MDWWSIGLFSSAGIVFCVLVYTVIRLLKKSGRDEAENEDKEYRLELIEERRKRKWANEKLINSLSDDELNKLLTKEWTKK